MSLYISHDNGKISYKGKQEKSDRILIEIWPEDPENPGQPALKKDCYYPGSGSEVLLKDSAMLLSELRKDFINNVDNYFINRFHKFTNTSLKADERIQAYQDFITVIEVATTEMEMNQAYINLIDLLEGN